MALIWADKVAETTTTTGTGALTLAGALTGYQAFSAVMTSPSDVCYYTITAVDSNGVPTGDWETGIGTYSASNTLTRTTVHASTNAGAAVSFAAGTKRVTLSQTATAIRGLQFSPPSAAAFTLASGDATNLTLADDVDVGLTVNGGAPVTGNIVRIATITLSTPGSDWDLIAKVNRLFPGTNYSGAGLVVHDSGTKVIDYGWRTDSGISVLKWNNLAGSFSATAYSGGLVSGMPFNWQRIRKVGTTLSFQYSADGKTWITLFSETATTFLASTSKVGVMTTTSRTTGPNIYMSVPYWSLTGPGV